MARSDQEKREIYSKWNKLINMSQNSLDSWSKDEDRLLASINRSEAKQEGGIQSGYDSFHRIKRRKGKKFEDWTNQDFDNANQEIGFNSRMLGGKPGEVVGDSGMSKWEISLKNWGHDPSLQSSPAHKKWKSWKQKHASVQRVMASYKRKALIKGATEVQIRHKVASVMSETQKESIWKAFLNWLVSKLDRLKKELFIEEIHTIVKKYISYTQKDLKNLKIEAPKSTQEKVLWKATKSLGLHKMIRSFRDVYVEDTAKSFDGLAKISSESTVYDEIRGSLVTAESDLLQARSDLQEELEVIKADIRDEKKWYNSKLENGIEYLKNRLNYFLNRARYYGNIGNTFLQKKLLHGPVNLYQKAMNALSRVEDSRIYGVKLLFVAAKVAGVALTWGLVWHQLPLQVAFSKYFVQGGISALKLLAVQIVGTYVLTGSKSITSSSVRKGGIFLGLGGAYAISAILKIKDFLVYLAKTGMGWVVDSLKSIKDRLLTRKASQEVVQQMVREMKKTTHYKKEVAVEYRKQLEKNL